MTSLYTLYNEIASPLWWRTCLVVFRHCFHICMYFSLCPLQWLRSDNQNKRILMLMRKIVAISETLNIRKFPEHHVPRMREKIGRSRRQEGSHESLSVSIQTFEQFHLCQLSIARGIPEFMLLTIILASALGVIYRFFGQGDIGVSAPTQCGGNNVLA